MAHERDGAPTRRRVLWSMSAAGALLAAGCSTSDGRPAGNGGTQSGSPAPGHAPAGVLAANFNEDPRGTTLDRLKGVQAGWVRGFVPMPEVRDGHADRQRGIAALLAAGRAGYGTVLSLKFPFTRRPLPAPGSAAMDTELNRVDQVLDATLGTVDILGIGNEPFLESRADDRRRGRFNAFYEALARHIVERRRKRFPDGCRTRLYMGALNDLENPATHDAAHARWLTFVHDTHEIEGVDIHPHVAAIEDTEAFLRYVLPRLRPEQRFLATEFSLVRLWKRHLKDRVPASFAHSRGIPADTPVWRALRDAAAHPLPQADWQRLLLDSAWFGPHRNFLTHQMQRFRATGRLTVAAYGVVQGPVMVHDFGPTSQPWLLNSVYSNLTAQPSADGTPAPNPAWYDEFRALQRAEDRLPVRTGTVPT
ncbi:hypothetical protein [Streptomyces catenulae]|uniref:Uncharacterized protein n=1 Tax=Streptomyces catenulae TaxID=66875 RepID=A0ABV2YSY2_9ACTN|nr:hypothetical protein [Streptomyces catenulae]